MPRTEALKLWLLFGIFICLALIAQKPVPTLSVGSLPPPEFTLPEIKFPSIPDSSNATVVQLSNNRIAIVDTRNDSQTFGKIIVLEYDEKTKRFFYVSDDSFHFGFQVTTYPANP